MSIPSRVVHVLGDADLGGIERFVLDLARFGSGRFEHCAIVVGQDGAFRQEFSRFSGPTAHCAFYGRSDPVGAVRLFRTLRALSPDIVHVHAAGVMLRGLARGACNGAVISHLWESARRTRSPRWLRLQYEAFSRACVATSEAALAELIRPGTVSAQKWRIIRPGVDLDHFAVPEGSRPAMRRQAGLSDGDLVIGFVGRIVEQKGLEYLVQAASQLRSSNIAFKLCIVGDGPLRACIEREAREGLSGDVLFLGPRKDVAELMNMFDILAVPSLWEPFGIVAIEGMAAGKPVVASGIDGLRESIISEKTGVLVPPANADALAESLRSLLMDPRKRSELGAAGRAAVESRFDARLVAEQVEKLYASLATG